MKKRKQYRWRPAYLAMGMAVALGTIGQVGYAATPEQGAAEAVATPTTESTVQAAPINITGKKMTSVTVEGNMSVSSDTIMHAIRLKVGEALTADRVKQDMQSIYDLGYFFDVTADFKEVPEGIQVVYRVMENPVLKQVVIKGNTVVTTSRLESQVTVPVGAVLNSKTWAGNAKAIEEVYRSAGYIMAKISDVNMAKDGTLTVTINEGLLEELTVKGNEKTKKHVITREIKNKVGKPFNSKEAKRSMEKIYNLGFFEDVNMKLIPGREPNAVVMETTVVEQKTGTFTIGAGYSSSDGMVGIIELGDKNFRGTGDSVKIHKEIGGYSNSGANYEFSYTHPWMDKKETSLSFSIYDMTNRYDDYNDNGDFRSTYDRQRKGWDITLGRPVNEYTRYYVTLKSRKDIYNKYVSGENYLDGTAAHQQYLKDNFGTTRSVILSRVFDTRDNVFNATTGSMLTTNVEIAGKGLGGNFNFNKFSLEGRKYYDVGSDHIIAVRGMLGYATGSMPDSQRFALGGESLRAYKDDEFKGNKMFAATIEYRMPLMKKIHGVVFAEAGNAWTGEGYQLTDLKTAIGCGIRMNTMLGPIKLDYGWGSKGGRATFGFGGQF
ncbi:BamA/OMP85 family outer membrane protein [Azotosporobacter soli]|uniref:BamA/OMP85 family outer membrane protein n=1 Tax=Azotosporobacter soli TaxID=3055040 RepID=UPI0031FF0586